MKSQSIKYSRILVIDNLIASGNRPTVTELLKALEIKGMKIDRSTLWRDLKTLEQEYNAPLDVQDYLDVSGEKKRGYIYTSKTYRVPAMLSSKEKINSAKMMSSLLDSIRGTQIYDETKEVFDELSTEVPVTDVSGTAPLKLNKEARIIFIGAPCVNIVDSTWNIVRESIDLNKRLKFNYKKIISDSEQNETTRVVDPYQLIFSRGNWHLWCYDYSRKERRLFNLSEMSSLEFHDNKKNSFILPDDFDFRKENAGYFGTFRTQEKYEIVLKMKGYAAKYAKIRIWGENQSIEEKDDGEIILHFTTSQFSLKSDSSGGPIMTWILGWGEEAIPLEPQELVNVWKHRIELMSKLAFTELTI